MYCSPGFSRHLPARHYAGTSFVAGAAFLLACGIGVAEPAGTDQVARGKYLFAAASCGGCHTVEGKELGAGGRRFDGPFGTVYSTNITPDRLTGIAAWTDAQIAAAIRKGRRPNGERLIPVHPYLSLAGMADDDLRALVAYLRTVPAVNRANQPKRMKVPLFGSVFLPAWLAAFGSHTDPPASAPVSGLGRGEYLVRSVSHCGECHTPRGITQATDNSRFLAGNPHGPDGSAIPNITPDPATGLTWTEEQIAEFLGTGNKPDGDVAGGLMGEVIGGARPGYKDLTEADRRAIAQYLKTIPSIRHEIRKKS
jgi:mono/diheme cytochrome c family protein